MTEACNICSNLRFQPLRPRRQLKTLIFAETWFQSDEVIVHYELQLEQDETFSIRTHESGGTLLMFSDHTIQVYTPEGQPDAWKGIIKCPELSEYAHSGRANQFIRSCLDRCLNLHPKCVQPGGHPPSRLIDVGLSHDDYVRLVETLPESRSEYIALSYCWGDVDVVRTISSNYEEMKTKILTSILPRTIQDAIIVTRGLGQRYLWVDALCIIQDSKLDWEIESANMASIYRSSLLTLAAATAAAASDGFLNQAHNVSIVRSAYQQTWHNEHGNKTILAARIVPDFDTHTEDTDDDEVLPLFLRGWTLQEQKLSTRIISYRRDELWWSCLSEPSCECQIINELPEEAKKFSFNSTHSISSAKEMYREWHNIVREYTMRALKYSSDRLPAIAGVARVVQDLTGSAYIAGLWKDNLVHDLTWDRGSYEVEGQSEIATSPGCYGPTFSWISVNRPVNYEWTDRWVKATKCHILAVESSVTGLNPFGHVKSAYLTISAPLLKSALLLRCQNSQESEVFLERYFISCGSKELRLHNDVALKTFERVNQDGIMEKSVQRSHIPNTRAESGTPVSLLHLGQPKHPRTKDTNIKRVYLVLSKCPTDMTRYERIGIAWQDCVIGKGSSEIPPFCDEFSVSIVTIV